jgi:hypothetical protein
VPHAESVHIDDAEPRLVDSHEAVHAEHITACLEANDGPTSTGETSGRRASSPTMAPVGRVCSPSSSQAGLPLISGRSTMPWRLLCSVRESRYLDRQSS